MFILYFETQITQTPIHYEIFLNNILLSLTKCLFFILSYEICKIQPVEDI